MAGHSLSSRTVLGLPLSFLPTTMLLILESVAGRNCAGLPADKEGNVPCQIICSKRMALAPQNHVEGQPSCPEVMTVAVP